MRADGGSVHASAGIGRRRSVAAARTKKGGGKSEERGRCAFDRFAIGSDRGSERGGWNAREGRVRRGRARTRMNSVPTAPEMPAIATLGPSGVLPARTVTAPAAGRRVDMATRRLSLARELGAAYAPRAPARALEAIRLCIVGVMDGRTRRTCLFAREVSGALA